MHLGFPVFGACDVAFFDCPPSALIKKPLPGPYRPCRRERQLASAESPCFFRNFIGESPAFGGESAGRNRCRISAVHGADHLVGIDHAGHFTKVFNRFKVFAQA